MTRYFTSRQGAIKRLMDLKRELARMNRPAAAIDGCRSDGIEILGLEQVLLDVRAGRVRWYRHSAAHEDQLVFIS
ncbi:conserved hypothetical protein [Burkholderia sp. 8Y]|uniref:hypothetical protein n=1 Tax=Burkholderia sp. 8Y TaxID=2653133 RepID=UPI0012F17F45|nr:hypothetical protein [Burkholderia sp. 8Y]VXB37194.1 conserved hypothetical protein [Burkholderia sp. 8Y]